jgi:hypothetical protein
MARLDVDSRNKRIDYSAALEGFTQGRWRRNVMAKITELPGPVPVSVVICDSIGKDLLTQRFHLLGLLTGIRARRFPMSYTFAVHATVVNLRQDMVAFFDIVDSEEEVIERSDDLALVKPDDVLDEAAVATVFEDATFLEAGDYFVRFWANRRLIIERRLNVRASEERE